MKITSTLTDEAVSAELGRRVQRARLDRQITQADLATASGIARPTVERFETSGVAHLLTLIRILRALGLLDRLDVLLPERTVRPIEELENRGESRKRVSRPRKPKAPAKSWTWGDEK